ncbi:MAG: two-component regulator propeller domain-containing protein [Acidobacteriota bacterium]
MAPTQEGLARFDGLRFTVFDSSNTRGVVGNFVYTLLADRDGSLWLGRHIGQSVPLVEALKLAVSIAQQHAGGTRDGLSDNSILSIHEDRDGVLWIGTNRGLNRFKDGRGEAVAIAGLSDDEIFGFLEDREGSLWIGTHASGLHRLRDGKFTTYGPPEGFAGSFIMPGSVSCRRRR